MISKKLEIALNKQISFEYASGYLYEFLSHYLADKGLHGFATFFKNHAKEEVDHARKFISFVQNRGGKIELEAIPAIKPNIADSVKRAVEVSLAHEMEVSGAINDLLTLAIEEKDYAAENFLRSFVDEQVEEEALFKGILDAIVFLGDNPVGVYELDKSVANK